jgi:hypothetical protein
MARIIILAQSLITAKALRQALAVGVPGLPPLAGAPAPDKSNVEAFECNGVKVETFLVESGVVAGLEAFQRIADYLEDIVAEYKTPPSGRLIVAVDRVRLGALNPLAVSGWEPLLGKLILAFPEIRWVFGVISDAPCEDGGELAGQAKGNDLSNTPERQIIRNHHLLSLSQSTWEPLLDPTGLREWVKQHAASTKTKDGLALCHIPERRFCAAALDEERGYAYLHAYICFRFGLRADVVGTETLAKTLFGTQGVPRRNTMLAIEDVFLNYPDKADDRHWSFLDQRTLPDWLPELDSPDIARVFVSIGERGKPRNEDRALRNQLVRRQLRHSGRVGSFTEKPLPGIFGFWKKSQLHRWFNHKAVDKGQRRHNGRAPFYLWPPTNQQVDDSANHSAPGALMVIAERMIDRAERLLEHTHSVPDAVWGATLATESLELVGDRTPTTALEALVLKHQFEAIAETQSSGVDFQIEIKGRLRDLRIEVSALCRRLSASLRDRTLINAELSVLRNLMVVFRDHQQFDEEQECLSRSRWLVCKLWFYHHPPAVPLFPFAAYGCFLLGGLPRFLGSLAAWILILSVGYWSLDYGGRVNIDSMTKGFQHAVETVFSMQAIHRESFHWLDQVAIVGSFFHLGVLVSHLYSLISRR